MKKFARFFVFCCASSAVLSACGLLIPDTSILNGSPQAMVTVQPGAVNTATAQPQPAQQRTVIPRPPTVVEPTSVPASPTLPPLPTATQPPPAPCNLIYPGVPFDVNYPEDTRLEPGQYFAKTWRLVNAGSCAWDRGYAAVWFSGANLGIYPATEFGGQVLPGSTVELTIEMIAPQEPGTYQSNWKLRASDGSLFGIGPNGESPFWVRIVVEDIKSPTPGTTTTPETTPTVSFSSGAVHLAADTGVDLDSGQINLPQQIDLLLTSAGEGMLLVPENGALLSPIEVTAPGRKDCSDAPVAAEPLPLDGAEAEMLICYRTAQGLPGRGLLTNIDAPGGQLDFEFITWAVP